MSAASPPLLETVLLTLQVPGRRLLSGLDWQVRVGEFWCVLGPNGAGKSSLLHAVSGLLPPASGQVRLQGMPLPSITPVALARLRGLLLQHQHDAFSLPVSDAVRAGRFAHGNDWNASADERSQLGQVLERVGVAHLAAADLLTLSGGERQRVALATLLAQDPALLLLDEPTSHQDIAAQLRIMQLLSEVASMEAGRAVVASCHDLNLAQRFATHILLLGPQVHAGPVSEVMRTDWLEQAFGCHFQVLENQGVRIFVPSQ